LRVGQLAAANLHLPGGGRVDARFDDQLAAMAAARDQGLIAGAGLSNASLEQPGPGASASSRTQARRGENRDDAVYGSWC
jgi:diketogulonate reductase-like aldo/keto reductase